jgi:hypothetical protein
LTELQDRLSRKQPIVELKNKISAQRYRIDEIKNQEMALEKKMWEFERER